MNLSLPAIDAISVVLAVVFYLIFPFGVMFWLGKYAESTMPPARSVSGVAGRLVFVGFLVWLWFIYISSGIMSWPPRPLERMRDRARTLEQVKLAGGWEAVTKGCDELMQLPTFYNYNWSMGRPFQPEGLPSADLPPALAALKPQIVRFERHSETNWAVSIRLRGGRRDNYNLRVMCAPPTNSTNTLPRFTSPPIVRQGRQLADRVYEF